jgi:hypothetical protein
MKVKKPWQHKEILNGLYEEQKLTIRTIAQILQTTPSNILYWMRKFEITTRKFEIGELNRGKKLSEEECQRLSDVAKERFKDPRNHPMYGRKHSEASKRKMSETKRRRRAERLRRQVSA